jgi:hypothetical protein
MDVTTTERESISSKFYLADELHICPECGAVMNELDRLMDGPYTFVWFKCSKSNCDGQWLQKKLNSHLR